MKTPRQWWSTKTADKKQNWYMLSILFLLIGSGFCEFSPWMALVAVIPALAMVALELSAPE